VEDGDIGKYRVIIDSHKKNGMKTATAGVILFAW
jgi:hypothetical protein